MPIKRVICPERIRQIPAHFSWVDHRLVRERYIERCDACAAALYLFLVCVADSRGLSYYADATLARRLSMAPARLEMARSELIRVGLIAWQRPIYQVLALDAPRPEPAPPPHTDVAMQLEQRIRPRIPVIERTSLMADDSPIAMTGGYSCRKRRSCLGMRRV